MRRTTKAAAKKGRATTARKRAKPKSSRKTRR
jgi:hypothetical protein